MPPELTDLLAGLSTFALVSVVGGIVLSIALTIGLTIFIRRLIKKTVGVNRDVLQNGISAKAKIVNVRQTGVMLNNQPQILFDLEVQPPGSTSYNAQTKAVIPMVNIPQFQPGVEVPVKIHPTDPTQVVFDVYQ